MTLTTDFGTVDGYVGAMKGVVLFLAPGTDLVDVTHDIPPRDVRAGAFALTQAAPQFPPGTIHVAVVDPGVGGTRAGVIVEAQGALFVGPDNGVLSMVPGPRVIHAIENAAFRREPVSPTFHGRDVFAPAAARLALGHAAAEAGPPLGALRELPGRQPGDGAPGTGEIIHVDAFGNLITSFGGDILTSGTWMLECLDAKGSDAVLTVTAGRTYVDVPAGALVIYVGSSGHVEVALRDGSAASSTGWARGQRVRLRRPG